MVQVLHRRVLSARNVSVVGYTNTGIYEAGGLVHTPRRMGGGVGSNTNVSLFNKAKHRPCSAPVRSGLAT